MPNSSNVGTPTPGASNDYINTPISISSNTPLRELKEFFFRPEDLTSFPKIQTCTEIIQGYDGDYSLEGTYLAAFVGDHGFLITKLIVEQQKRALISFLSQFSDFADNENILYDGAKVSVMCERLRSKATSGFSARQIHYFCTEIVNSSNTTNFRSFLLKALDSADRIPTATTANTDSGKSSNGLHLHRILVENTERAFSWHYNGEHALTAFRDYLDVQWLKMREECPGDRGTRQSRCGTIIQSSCAGKSRLADRYTQQLFHRFLMLAWVNFLSHRMSVFRPSMSKQG
jgi:hypothetical protein